MSAPTGTKTIETGGLARAVVPVEQPVTLFVNDQEIATLQATPEHLDELAIGFLFSEGIISGAADIDDISVNAREGLVHVLSSAADVSDVVYKKRYLTSGCGKGVTFSSLGHARGQKPLSSAVSVTASHIHEMMKAMTHGAVLYKQSGGLHSSALANQERLLVQREDVGRHNTLDKIVGRIVLDDIATADAFLLTTGRISYEMVVKAAKMRVPIIVSRTAVTDLAIEVARQVRICLVGYARAGKLSVYTEPYRVTQLTGGEGE